MNNVCSSRGMLSELSAESASGVGFWSEEEMMEAAGARAVGAAGAVVTPASEAEPTADRFPLSIIQLAADLEASGYSDRTIAHACELTLEDLITMRELDEFVTARGDAQREAIRGHKQLDSGWDELEQRAVASLKLELAGDDLLTPSEKISIARMANQASRRKHREEEMAVKKAAAAREAGPAVTINSHSVLQLELPKAFVDQLAHTNRAGNTNPMRVVSRDESEVIDMIQDDASHVDFEQAGKILGVDLSESSTAQIEATDPVDILNKTNSTRGDSAANPGSELISNEAG